MTSGKALFAGAGKQVQFPEKSGRLSGQGHGMGNAHLHAAAVFGIFPSGGWHNPERLVQINLRPASAAKLGTPQGQIGQNLECITDNGSALIFVDAAQEMADSGGIGDGGVMLLSGLA